MVAQLQPGMAEVLQEGMPEKGPTNGQFNTQFPVHPPHYVKSLTPLISLEEQATISELPVSPPGLLCSQADNGDQPSKGASVPGSPAATVSYEPRTAKGNPSKSNVESAIHLPTLLEREELHVLWDTYIQ